MLCCGCIIEFAYKIILKNDKDSLDDLS
jgi:hypothetical protein